MDQKGFLRQARAHGDHVFPAPRDGRVRAC